MPREVNIQRERFVLAYTRFGPTFGNATASAIKAGYSENTAEQIGYQLLQKTSVQQRIAEIQGKRLKAADITAERVLVELARVGFYDPRRMFDEDGNPLSLHELDDDTAAAIGGLEIFEEYEGKGEDRVKIGETKKWKINPKVDALKSLAQVLGMVKTQVEHSGSIDVNDLTPEQREAEIRSILTAITGSPSQSDT